MKKILLALALFALTMSVAAQEPPVMRINGKDWKETAETNKAAFIVGVYAGLDIYAKLMQWVYQSNPAAPDSVKMILSRLFDYANLPINSNDLVGRIDHFYDEPNQLYTPVWQAIVIVSGKTWGADNNPLLTKEEADALKLKTKATEQLDKGGT